MFAQQLLAIAKRRHASSRRAKSGGSHGRAMRIESLESRELFAADFIESPIAPTYIAVEMSVRTVLCDTTQQTTACNVDAVEATIVPSWQNPSDPLDVNNDGVVTPIDALIVINDLNQNAIRELPQDNPQTVDPRYIDVSGDGFVTPVDALQVINFVNDAIGIGEGAGSNVEENDSAAEMIDLPTVDVRANEVAENAGLAELSVTLSAPSAEVVTVSYTTLANSGTAVADQDYTPTSGTLVFQPGEQQKTFRVEIIEDLFTESDESFLVRLSSVDGAALALAPAGNHASVTILANDSFVGPLPISPAAFAQSADEFFATLGSKNV